MPKLVIVPRDLLTAKCFGLPPEVARRINFKDISPPFCWYAWEGEEIAEIWLADDVSPEELKPLLSQKEFGAIRELEELLSRKEAGVG